MDEAPTEVRFPNGEAFSDMRVRVLRAVDAIRRAHEGQTVMVVSHGGVNRILIAHALQMPDHCLFRLAQGHAAINLLSFMTACLLFSCSINPRESSPAVADCQWRASELPT